MNVEQFITILPDYLQANPTAFSAAALAALDDILDNPDSLDQTRDDFVEWLRAYKPEREQLRTYAEHNREVGQQRPAPASAEATTLTNYFQAARQIRSGQSPASDKPAKA